MKSRIVYFFVCFLAPTLASAGLLEHGFQADYTLSKNDFDVGVAEYRLYPQPTGTLIYQFK